MELNLFSGEYEVTLDPKGRISIPGKLKKQLPEGSSNLILGRGFEKCLTLYTIASWKNVIQDIYTKNDYDPKVRQFRRQFLGGATEVELDAAGRLLLPQSLREFANLEKDIIIAANIDRFEIWNMKNYNDVLQKYSDEEFSKLSQEVMIPKDKI